jgi:hypothetical protein
MNPALFLSLNALYAPTISAASPALKKLLKPSLTFVFHDGSHVLEL